MQCVLKICSRTQATKADTGHKVNVSGLLSCDLRGGIDEVILTAWVGDALKVRAKLVVADPRNGLVVEQGLLVVGQQVLRALF